jgi:hypothetical protein
MPLSSNSPLKNTDVEVLKVLAAETDLLTPRQFAKMMGTSPQQVYALIRRGVMQTEQCTCGRTVMRVSKMKERFEAHKRETGNE